jgi:hypothetical protein
MNMPILVRELYCYEDGLCCYLVTYIKTYYVHYSCFTSICDLFTYSPSYLNVGMCSVTCYTKETFLRLTICACSSWEMALNVGINALFENMQDRKGIRGKTVEVNSKAKLSV